MIVISPTIELDGQFALLIEGMIDEKRGQEIVTRDIPLSADPIELQSENLLMQ